MCFCHSFRSCRALLWTSCLCAHSWVLPACFFFSPLLAETQSCEVSSSEGAACLLPHQNLVVRFRVHLSRGVGQLRLLRLRPSRCCGPPQRRVGPEWVATPYVQLDIPANAKTDIFHVVLFKTVFQRAQFWASFSCVRSWNRRTLRVSAERTREHWLPFK